MVSQTGTHCSTISSISSGVTPWAKVPLCAQGPTPGQWHRSSSRHRAEHHQANTQTSVRPQWGQPAPSSSVLVPYRSHCSHLRAGPIFLCSLPLSSMLLVGDGDVPAGAALTSLLSGPRSDEVVAVASMNYDPIVSKVAEVLAAGRAIRKRDVE